MSANQTSAPAPSGSTKAGTPAKLFYIKERQNPQLGTYYVACGKLSKTKAARLEKSKYGFNILHGFAYEADYLVRLTELREKGESVHGNSP